MVGKPAVPGLPAADEPLEGCQAAGGGLCHFFAALGSSNRPLIYAGGGVINAGAAYALREFSQ